MPKEAVPVRKVVVFGHPYCELSRIINAEKNRVAIMDKDQMILGLFSEQVILAI